MRIRQLACFSLLATSGFPALATAQRTGDQARLIFTVSGGYVGGGDLWTVSRQPVVGFNAADTFALGRQIRSSIGIGFGGAYFPGENIGFTGEAFLLGLGYEDSCRQVATAGDPKAAAVCTSVQGSQKAGTAVVLSTGTIFRVNSRKPLSPYGRLNAGLVISNQSPLRTVGQFRDPAGPVDLIIYEDLKHSRVSPGLALGGGVTAAIAKGYQIRWEVRDNIVGLQRVTGPTPQTGLVPPHKLRFKHIFSLTLGFEVVLERKPGRRY